MADKCATADFFRVRTFPILMKFCVHIGQVLQLDSRGCGTSPELQVLTAIRFWGRPKGGKKVLKSFWSFKSNEIEMSIVLKTGFVSVTHYIKFQPQTVFKGKLLVLAGHVRDVEELRTKQQGRVQ
ncbi:hypothetical protein evm_000636 [Chilo suppressalis]|nr:hypothetical protein evm_000636 [Chilo suppressalis]